MKIHKIIFFEKDRKSFEQIKSGEKAVETRAGGMQYENIKKKDMLRIICGEDEIIKEVKKVKVYKSISELLKKYNVKDIIPNLSTYKELLEHYYTFPRYKERIKKYGIIALEI